LQFSRARRAAPNDADRLRKYLARFGLDWNGVRGSQNPRELRVERPR
jgi:transcriptional regulatory protein RtcR